MQPAKVYDSNGQVLADAVRELGGEPKRLGITHDDIDALRERLRYALGFADIVLLSVERARAREMFLIALLRNSTIPGLWRTAWRSSLANRSASPQPAGAR
jgi:putative molybdopterin biosynthesis protein